MMKKNLLLTALVAGAVACEAANAQNMPGWSQPQKPFKVFGNTYYVGTRGLSSILITSDQGHVLIDGAIPEAAQQIAANVRALGFKLEDVKLILNSHVHFDHAGGIAELQKLSGAVVAGSPIAAKVLNAGPVGTDDPQYGTIQAIAPATNVRVFKDKETQRVGSLAITPHLTPGHTPGGTSWTWQSCENQQCLNIVYADSLNPISAPGYQYTASSRKPTGQQQLEQSFAALEGLSCDVMLTPHPELADLFAKLQRKEGGDANAFRGAPACAQYVETYRGKLRDRVNQEIRPQK
ncbi:MAG TPA: subclass B3 metallo-beta-lactamase [Steroidobacteraceae bacterium]|nr:subclass B3 metallo-beta-lactamase [Steroidobacteraceae bacterium]